MDFTHGARISFGLPSLTASSSCTSGNSVTDLLPLVRGGDPELEVFGLAFLVGLVEIDDVEEERVLFATGFVALGIDAVGLCFT